MLISVQIWYNTRLKRTEINITHSHTLSASPGELLVGCTRFGLILVESMVSASTRVHMATMAHDPQQSTEHTYFDFGGG